MSCYPLSSQTHRLPPNLSIEFEQPFVEQLAQQFEQHNPRYHLVRDVQGFGMHTDYVAVSSLDNAIEINYALIDSEQKEYVWALQQQQDITVTAITAFQKQHANPTIIDITMRFQKVEDASALLSTIHRLCLETQQSLEFCFYQCLDAENPAVQELMKRLDGRTLAYDDREIHEILEGWLEQYHCPTTRKKGLGA